MNVITTTGLGDPEPIGKKSLFQPPGKKQVLPEKSSQRGGEGLPRLRITTDLTKQALETIQALQHRHRMQTGRTLPAWKIVSAAVELYGKQKKDENATTS